MRKTFVLAFVVLFCIGFGRELAYVATLETGVEGDRFGVTVVALGDVNGDGYGDMLICAEGSYVLRDYPGKAYLYLGGPRFAGEAAVVFSGEAPGDHFGASATALGDINGDGFGDFAIGADKNDEGGTDAGKVYIFFGGKKIDTKPDLVIVGGRANDWFGSALAGGDDINGDGKPDLLVGAPYGGKKYAGTVSIFLGGFGFEEPALVLSGEDAGDSYGARVAMLGDVTADGIADFAVSAVYADAGDVNDAGCVYVYAGGNVISQKPVAKLSGSVPREQMGFSVCGPGDITGDGVGDILVGAPGGGPAGMGAVYVFAGGQVLRPEPFKRFLGQHQNDLFGLSVSGAGDLNADRIADFFVGAPYTDAGHYHAGRVEFYAGGKEMSIKDLYHTNGTAEESQYGYCVAYIPDFFGRGKGLYVITSAGRGSGNAGKTKVLVYR